MMHSLQRPPARDITTLVAGAQPQPELTPLVGLAGLAEQVAGALRVTSSPRFPARSLEAGSPDVDSPLVQAPPAELAQAQVPAQERLQARGRVQVQVQEWHVRWDNSASWGEYTCEETSVESEAMEVTVTYFVVPPALDANVRRSLDDAVGE